MNILSLNIHDEIIDTYSDDLEYLREGRIALLSHPLRSEDEELCNASFCRIFSIVMVNNIEAMLVHWKTIDKHNILNNYLDDEKKNGEKVTSLMNAFVEKNISIDKNVFRDYLAIKYIRNAITHSSWNKNRRRFHTKHQFQYVRRRKFPTDTRKLNSGHLQRMEWVNQNMMYYIHLTGSFNLNLLSETNHGNYLKSPKQNLKSSWGILNRSDWREIHWKNLSKISKFINFEFQKIAYSEKYYWAKDLTEYELETNSHLKNKELFYLSLYKASDQEKTHFESLEQYANSALDSWNEYRRYVPELNDLEGINLEKINDDFEKIFKYHIFPKSFFPEWEENMPLNLQRKIIKKIFGKTAPLRISDLIKIHIYGSKAYHSIPNIVILILFSTQIPIISPQRNNEWNEIFQFAANVFEAGQKWYSFVESRSEYENSNIQFYREMMEKMLSI